LDSKAPTALFQDFILGEVRYSSLTRTFPERAEKLFKVAEENAQERLRVYQNCVTKKD